MFHPALFTVPRESKDWANSLISAEGEKYNYREVDKICFFKTEQWSLRFVDKVFWEKSESMEGSESRGNGDKRLVAVYNEGKKWGQKSKKIHP